MITKKKTVEIKSKHRPLAGEVFVDTSRRGIILNLNIYSFSRDGQGRWKKNDKISLMRPEK